MSRSYGHARFLFLCWQILCVNSFAIFIWRSTGVSNLFENDRVIHANTNCCISEQTRSVFRFKFISRLNNVTVTECLLIFVNLYILYLWFESLSGAGRARSISGASVKSSGNHPRRSPSPRTPVVPTSRPVINFALNFPDLLPLRRDCSSLLSRLYRRAPHLRVPGNVQVPAASIFAASRLRAAHSRVPERIPDIGIARSASASLSHARTHAERISSGTAAPEIEGVALVRGVAILIPSNPSVRARLKRAHRDLNLVRFCLTLLH